MKKSMSMDGDGKSLLNKLKDKGFSGDELGILLNDILTAVKSHRLSIRKIVDILNSNDEVALKSTAWLISELGSGVCSVLDDVKGLIKSSDWETRFYIANTYLLCSYEGESLFELCKLIEDKHPSVRWKALDALCRLNEQQIAIIYNYLKIDKKETVYIKSFDFLINSKSSGVSEKELEFMARNNDPVIQYFSIIAGVQMKFSVESLKRIAEMTSNGDLMGFCEGFEYI